MAGAMEICSTALPGVVLIVPRRLGDARGYFAETWNIRRMRESGLDLAFVQDNESLSAAPNTLRGLHYQAPPFAQSKLVRVVAGAILDVAVDVRRGSPTFGRWVAERLDAETGAQLLIPRGFLHGFLTLEPDTKVLYKVDNPYDAASDGSVAWNDPDLAIGWGADPASVTLSGRDQSAPRFRDWTSPFVYEAPKEEAPSS
jgi:dTDP-4-dehydrorhamnose 3,5-epimerase